MKTTHNLKGCRCPKGVPVRFCLGTPPVKPEKIDLIVKLIEAVGMKKAYLWLKKHDKSAKHIYIKSKPMGKIYFSGTETDWKDGGGYINIDK